MLKTALILLLLVSSSASAQEVMSEDAQVLATMESCYGSLTSNRNGMNTDDKVSEFNDPSKSVLVLPGMHESQMGIFVLQYGSSSAAFQPLTPKKNPATHEPIEEFKFQILNKGKTIDLRYTQQVDTYPPHPTRSMTDPNAAACDFTTSPAVANAKVVQDFYPQGSDLNMALEKELIRRVHSGVEYHKFIAPQPLFVSKVKEEEVSLNRAAIEQCEQGLKRSDFPDLFAAFDDAQMYYRKVSRGTGDESAPSGSSGKTTSGGF